METSANALALEKFKTAETVHLQQNIAYHHELAERELRMVERRQKAIERLENETPEQRLSRRLKHHRRKHLRRIRRELTGSHRKGLGKKNTAPTLYELLIREWVRGGEPVDGLELSNLTLAKRLEACERTVRRAVNTLSRTGLVKPLDNGCKPNRYLPIKYPTARNVEEFDDVL